MIATASNHAITRWCERFPGQDIQAAFGRAAEIGRRVGLGYEEMVRANPGIDPWLPGEGTEVLLPRRFVLPAGVRQGILINIAEYPSI